MGSGSLAPSHDARVSLNRIERFRGGREVGLYFGDGEQWERIVDLTDARRCLMSRVLGGIVEYGGEMVGRDLIAADTAFNEYYSG